MVIVAKFFKIEDAYLFRSFLESEGIEAHVFDEHMAQLFWIYTQMIGGIRVEVANEDAERAHQLYVEYNESMKTAPFVERPVRAWPIVALVSLLFSIPLMLFGRKSVSNDSHDTESEI